LHEKDANSGRRGKKPGGFPASEVAGVVSRGRLGTLKTICKTKEKPMAKITVKRLYHIGIPVNDIQRAEQFYVDVLGMKVKGRGTGERESNRPFFELLGYWPKNLRLRTAEGDAEVVLFERPKPIERDWQEDSFCHSAFSTSKEDFDLALEKLTEWGARVHLGPIGYGGGRTLYFFDSEGNFLQLGERG
jgi:catechol 2,3-dioxygenase-like lactoylglutathione lyase family enzyme